MMSLKNSNDIIGNRTHDLPACGAVPQPTVPPHTLYSVVFDYVGRTLFCFQKILGLNLSPQPGYPDFNPFMIFIPPGKGCDVASY
jgi:hypothetical protein